MWFLVAIVAASVILAVVLTPKPKTDGAKPAALSDFNFPRSKEADPVPRLYGTVKVKGPNTIYAGDFSAEAIKKKQKTGLFSSKKVTVGFKYFIGLDMCVCLGPDVRFRKMWLGKDLIWTGCLTGNENTAVINLPNLYGGQDKNGGVAGTVEFYGGSFDQAQSPYLLDKIGEDVPAYVGFAHIVFRKFYWGNSPSIQPLYVEAALHTNSLGIGDCKHIMPNGLDANPIEVLYDLHVNDWGNLDVDPALIDVANWREVGAELWGEANGISMLVSNATTGGELTREIMQQINATYFQDPSTGLIQIKLIRDDYDIEDLPILGPSEIVEISNYTKVLWSETLNKVRVKYANRANNYEDGIASQEDFANIRSQGRIKASDVSMPLCYDSDLAARLATRELSNVAVPLYKADLVVNRKAAALLPGSAFVLHWPAYGIEAMVMRVRKINLGKRKDGQVVMHVVQDQFSTPALVDAVPPPSGHENENFPPGEIDDMLIWELPYWLDALVAADLESRIGYYRLAAFASRPTTASLDYTGYLDSGGDAEDDVEVLEHAPYSTSAQLTENLDRLEGWLTGVAATVTIGSLTAPSALADGSVTTVRNGQGLFLLNGELLAYETFTDNGGGSYTLENVHRALLDTGYAGGVAGEKIWFVDNPEAFFDTDMLPELAEVYFLDTTYQSTMDESLVDRIAVEPIGRKDLPLPPDGVTIDTLREAATVLNVAGTYTIAWAERNRLAAEIQTELDPSQTPEADTTYRVQIVLTGETLVFEADELAVPEVEFTPLAEDQGAGEVRVWAKRNGDLSLSYAVYPLTIAGDSLVIDGMLVHIDGDTVEAD